MFLRDENTIRIGCHGLTSYKFLKNLIHEYIHAVKYKYLGFNVPISSRREVVFEKSQVGIRERLNYSDWRLIDTHYTEKFAYLNEGVTEKIATEVFDEYLVRTGLNLTVDPEDPLSYVQIVQFVDELSGTLAAKLEVSPDMVWNGFKQALFTLSSLSDPKLAQASKKALGYDVFARLSRIALYNRDTHTSNVLTKVSIDDIVN